MRRLLALLLAPLLALTLDPSADAAPLGRTRAAVLAPAQPFDAYVDSARGRNTNSGKTRAAPFADFSALFAANINKGVGIARGSTFRSELQPPHSGSAARPLVFAAYGSGARPLILGSEQISSGAWSLSGSEYTVATALHQPNTGGPTPAITWINSGGTETFLYKGTAAGSLTTGQYIVTGGLFRVRLPGDVAPTALDKFEIGQRNCVFSDFDHLRYSGLNCKYTEGYGYQFNTGVDITDVWLTDSAGDSTSADVINVNNGSVTFPATNLRFADLSLAKAPADGGGGGDCISIHGAFSSGIMERILAADCGKLGINTNGGTWLYHDLELRNAVFYVDGGVGTPGAHTVRRVRVTGQAPNAAAAAQMFFFGPNLDPAATIDIVGVTIARGGNGTVDLRGIRLQGGTIIQVKNVAVWCSDNSGTSHIGFAAMGGGTFSAGAESNTAIGGACGANTNAWPAQTNPVTINTVPFVGMSTFDVRPANGSAIAAAGIAVTGVTTGSPPDIGYTAVP